MDKLLEIGEIGLLHDFPSEVTFLTDENKLLKQRIGTLKLEKWILVCSIIALASYLIWREIRKSDEDYNS